MGLSKNVAGDAAREGHHVFNSRIAHSADDPVYSLVRGFFGTHRAPAPKESNQGAPDLLVLLAGSLPIRIKAGKKLLEFFPGKAPFAGLNRGSFHGFAAVFPKPPRSQTPNL